MERAGVVRKYFESARARSLTPADKVRLERRDQKLTAARKVRS